MTELKPLFYDSHGDPVYHSDLHDECPTCVAKGEDMGILRAENARLREALQFYATKENYYEEIKDHIFRTTPIREDGGKTAYKALEGKL